MLAKVHSFAIIGLEGAFVEVEVDTARGLPRFAIVGLPDTVVQEIRERVQPAIKNAGLTFPGGHLTVNLAPASLRKEGPAYYLPIALGTLAATGQLRPGSSGRACSTAHWSSGKLSLDGSVRHVAGVLPMVALAAKEGFKRIFVPAGDAAEAAISTPRGEYIRPWVIPEPPLVKVSCPSTASGAWSTSRLLLSRLNISTRWLTESLANSRWLAVSIAWAAKAPDRWRFQITVALWASEKLIEGRAHGLADVHEDKTAT